MGMEDASKAIFVVLDCFSGSNSIDDIFLLFVRQLEIDYAESHNIELFIFALRAFFCCSRASELCGNIAAIQRIQTIWNAQNDAEYSSWLASTNDDPDHLKWEKWTYQSKNAIFNEFLTSRVCTASTEPKN